TVSVTQPGFQNVVRTGVPVVAGQTFTVNFQLSLGTVTQTITVTSAAPVIDTTSTTMGTTRTSQEISRLPINLAGGSSRAAIAVAYTIPGVNFGDNGIDEWEAMSRSPINGIPASTWGYELDGVEASSGEAENGQDFMPPTPELIEEVRITD